MSAVLELPQGLLQVLNCHRYSILSAFSAVDKDGTNRGWHRTTKQEQAKGVNSAEWAGGVEEYHRPGKTTSTRHFTVSFAALQPSKT